METPVKTISRNELKSKLDRHENFTLLEALAKAAYDHVHLPTAKNLPPDQVRTVAPTLIPDKDAEIIVYCASPTWHASENAARELAAMGYTNVRDFSGGKQEWLDAKLPTETFHKH
jgi:rhodanese-related sulfurtransferase